MLLMNVVHAVGQRPFWVYGEGKPVLLLDEHAGRHVPDYLCCEKKTDGRTIRR